MRRLSILFRLGSPHWVVRDPLVALAARPREVSPHGCVARAPESQDPQQAPRRQNIRGDVDRQRLKKSVLMLK